MRRNWVADVINAQNATFNGINWESWLLFFPSGIYETANQAVQTSRKILELFQNDQRHIETFGRSLATTLRVYKILQSTP